MYIRTTLRPSQLGEIADSIGVRILAHTKRNFFKVGKSLIKVRLFPERGSDKYRRFGRFGRLNACCWHAHMEFFREVYKMDPHATIRTMFVTYHSAADLEGKKYIAFDRNVGPVFQPVAYGETCKCTE